jgi:hypothetical protein
VSLLLPVRSRTACLILPLSCVDDPAYCLPPLVHDTPLSLLPQELLDFADLFLNFAGSLFVFAFGFQLGILADFPGDLLDFALYFVKLASRLGPSC